MLTRHVSVKAAWVTERHTITKEINPSSPRLRCPSQSTSPARTHIRSRA